MRAAIELMLVMTAIVAVGCESDGTNDSAKSSEPTESAALPAASTPRTRAAGRDDDGKTELINPVMRLSRDESAMFWPIYHDYERELFALGDERVEFTRKFVRAQVTDSLDDAQAKTLADDWFRLESRRLKRLRKYHQQIATELSPVRAAQFPQIEHRVGVVTGLVVPSEVPLVQEQLTQRQ